MGNKKYRIPETFADYAVMLRLAMGAYESMADAPLDLLRHLYEAGAIFKDDDCLDKDSRVIMDNAHIGLALLIAVREKNNEGA